MLVVDAFMTVLTWLPYYLFYSITLSFFSHIRASYSERQTFALDVFMFALIMTNAFSTPIVYFVFNRHFRVSSMCVICSYVLAKSLEQQVFNYVHVSYKDCAALFSCFFVMNEKSCLYQCLIIIL